MTFFGDSLPSSNGFFTCRSVARMYGALANGGLLEDGSRLVSPKAVDVLHQSLAGERVPPPGDATTARATWGRLGLGFGPWEVQELHGSLAASSYGHGGIGGCVGFSCPATQLGVCVMKNTYEPISCIGEVSPDVASIVGVIRRELQMQPHFKCRNAEPQPQPAPRFPQPDKLRLNRLEECGS